MQRIYSGLEKQAAAESGGTCSGDVFKGLYAYLSGKYDQAISFFRDIMKVEPNHFYTLLRIGDAYQQERNYSEAIKFHSGRRRWMRRALRPSLPLQMTMLSASYDEAVSVIQEVIKKIPPI